MKCIVTASFFQKPIVFLFFDWKAMTFAFVRPWYFSIFKNSIFHYCNVLGTAVVKVKSFPFLSEKRNAEKCCRKLVAANNAKTKAMHQRNLYFMLVQQQQGNNKTNKETKTRDVRVVFFLGGGGGGREGDIFEDNCPSRKIPKAQITFLIKI